MPLDSGAALGPFTLAYQTYGTLNAERSNAILLCHALTGDQFVLDTHPITGKPGWWERLVGPGKPIDTERYFVICSNVIGGCMGSAGPAETNPKTGKPYGLDFPVLTIADMVRAQKLLIDRLGIDKLVAVIGGSMGGMQALQWAASYPERVQSVIPIAAAARHSSQNIAFHEVGRQAIMADPNWHGGSYYERGKPPTAGLAVARMAAHITYLSEAALQRKFGRALQDRDSVSYGFEADFQVESYLRHQGITFVDRFDANSYLYITRAMDYFDLSRPPPGDHGGVAAPVPARSDDELIAALTQTFKETRVKFCLVSFTSDWLFPTAESLLIVKALNAANADVSFVEIDTDKGHDAFLLEEPEFWSVVRGFLEGLTRRLDGRKTDAQAPKVRRRSSGLRLDLELIADLIEPGSSVLDIGSGDGALLDYLVHEKQVDGRGLELAPDKVAAAVGNGLPVIQGDANTDLTHYRPNAFDYVILSQTLQAMHNPRATLEQMVQIGRHAIVSFLNFGFWRVRGALFLQGRMPVSESLPYQWWETPNIHHCTIKDFLALTQELDLEIVEMITLDAKGRVSRDREKVRRANLLAEQAVILLKKRS
jgi:homoserine O-acetyltransferase